MSQANQALLEPKAVGDITGSFYVPAYQRGYRWTVADVDRLLHDIWDSEGKPYYLQPVVVKRLEADRWELVDGQQRFTTLYLIFQFMKHQGLQSSGAGYSLEYETRPGSAEFLDAPDERQRHANIDYHHIYAAYERIQAWFEAHDHRRQWAANRLYDYLFTSVKIIWCEAPPDLDSVTLFTRLNVGRIPLTDAELVKASVLARSQGRPGVADKSEQIAAQWDAFERDLRAPELWSYVTGRHEEEATHIGLLLDTLADRVAGRPEGRHRPRYYTFEALRPRIESDPQQFWDDVVGLHSQVVGWYEDRNLFHKVGYLVAVGDSFQGLVELTADCTRREVQARLDDRIRNRLALTADDLNELDYERKAGKCSEVLLLMNVETVRRRRDSTERYSFRAHARGAWSLEHIHAQNAQEMRRDEKLWTEWLTLQRPALVDVPGLDGAVRERLLTAIDDLLATMADPSHQAVGNRFDELKAAVERALSDSTWSEGDSVHSISNLALLGSGDNSALSNSTFDVKRREIIRRDKEGAYIPACTRNVFLKYYTDSDAQQLHFWGALDREAYLAAIRSTVEPYLTASEGAR